mgnify:CR=1 FL=1
MIQNNEFDQLLEEVSPQYYREFRRLYNEMLGYLEREEFDKIEELSKRSEAMIGRAFYAQLTLHKRLKQYKKQHSAVTKSTLHQRFRNPKKTLPITHPFPIKNPPDLAAASPESSPVVASESTLEKDRQVDHLMAEMAAYDRDSAADAADANNVTLNVSATDTSLAAPIKGATGKTQLTEAPEDSVDDEGGVSIRDDLKDESLYFRKKGQNEDIDRAKDVAVDADKDVATPQPPVEEPSAGSADGRSRKERIWDYINKDKQKGGIDHDL